MKLLVIQIPCYNEEQTLEIALGELPRQVPGFDRVEWLVIDDGSADRTVEVARRCGVDHIVQHPKNLGLARAYMTGMNKAMELGADVVVNTDADNQYNAADIPLLTEPILAGRAEIVIGTRPIDQIEHFSPIKKFLQKLGSGMVRSFSKTEVQDAPSGFRAISRQAALRLNVFNRYTYTLETIIQAGRQGLTIESVPIRTNGFLRPSRLVRSIYSYVRRSVSTMLRIYIIYSPFRFFATVSGFFAGFGVLFLLNFLWFYMRGAEDTHVPSLLIGSLLLGMALLLVLMGVIADLQAINRKLLEDIQWRLRREDWGREAKPQDNDVQN